MEAMVGSCDRCGQPTGAGALHCSRCGAALRPARVAPDQRAGLRVALPSALRFTAGMMFSPATRLTAALETIPLPMALAVPVAAFALFFFQAGLDRVDVEAAELGEAVGLAAAGAATGAIAVPLMAAFGWGAARLSGGTGSPGWTIRAFSLSYSPTLLYVVLGLAANLVLGWHTAAAFGVTGVLWAFGPIIAILRRLTGGNQWLSLAVATACGALLLGAWSIFGPDLPAPTPPAGTGS